MNIILIDDEQIALSDLERTIKTACPDSKTTCFTDAEQAIHYLASHPSDILFLDIEMPGTNGLSLAKTIKELRPDTNIIFVTGHSKYAIDAFSLHASGYIVKPASIDAINKELINLRHPLRELPDKKLCVHTFGNFEVFCNGQPVKFSRSKAKELFAYLVDRKGAGCTTSELCSILWESKTYNLSIQKQFQTIVSELTKLFREIECDDIFIKRRNILPLTYPLIVIYHRRAVSVPFVSFPFYCNT